MFDIKTPTGLSGSIFSTRSETEHRGFRRTVANAYSMSAMKELEPMADECSAILLHKMGKFVERGEAGDGVGVVDLGIWVHVSVSTFCLIRSRRFLVAGSICRLTD